MNKHNYKALQSKVIETNLKPVPLLNLNSGYINRASNMLPAREIKPLACLPKLYFDYKLLRLDSVKDKVRFFKKT
jgi:hypothetical protein